MYTWMGMYQEAILQDSNAFHKALILYYTM